MVKLVYDIETLPPAFVESSRKLTPSKFRKLLFVALFFCVGYYLIFTNNRLSGYAPCMAVKEMAVDSEMDTLIIVPGHAVFIGNDYSDSSLSSDVCWILESFQIGQTKLFVEHIRKGIEKAASNSKALLVFSGGQTRMRAGPLSEAQSYYQIAQNHNWFGIENVQARSTTEEFARDSYENLLFSICRFKEVVGSYPKFISVVGFKFKANRFIDLHRFAIKFPTQYFSYIEVHDGVTDDLRDSASADFSKDLYGCSEKLREKKKSRNPYKRNHSYADSCPDLKGLLEYCGEAVFADSLPWKLIE